MKIFRCLQSIAVTTSTANCNAMVKSILKQIEETTALKELKNQPEYVADITQIFDRALGNQSQGSKKQITRVAVALAKSLNRNDDKKAVQDIKDNGIVAIMPFREKRVAEFISTYSDQIYGIAKATVKRPNWEPIAHRTYLFSLQISKFCGKSIGVIDGIKMKIVASISSFVKKTTENVRTLF